MDAESGIGQTREYLQSLKVPPQVLLINYKKKLRNQTVVNQMIKINFYQ